MGARELFLEPGDEGAATPIWLVGEAKSASLAKRVGEFLESAQVRWVGATQFRGKAGEHLLIPAGDGSVACVLLGTGRGEFLDPCGPNELGLGRLASALPKGNYKVASQLSDGHLAAVSWGLGAYKFARYKKGTNARRPRLTVPETVDLEAVVSEVDSVWLGRDLINTTAADLGPEELEKAVRDLGSAFGAVVSAVCGDDLIGKNFPMIHAVGRASPREPRLVELNWSPKKTDRKTKSVTLVGKGICFDTGGLNLKPGAGMLLMKKDMGGAATALTLGRMIMASGLNVKLRILIAAGENSVSGDAYRPSDVLVSRSGQTVEIGNTDAEGRLVLADALSYADEDAPDVLLSLATLTGSARVALGPDLPALFTDDDSFAAEISQCGEKIGDPVWRLPLWEGYDRRIDSAVADMKNVSNGPFAGAITAALFLKRFVAKSKCFAHVDLYGWVPKSRALGPKGGEPMTARAIFRALSGRVSV